ncbi:hypothetical protein M4951_23440 [Blastopirellula sp. J2-11]|uniref:hypothetical protein n=1 Tax=Blastopirellula sp. J2-11 TaxID=2943192 RepID=UPI0021C88053|nr:hypothetical protein [Blastopirellula sp. J2-11]UUO06295.1 hypothetical protein M4951_23440 [Blastopirellula sp. J2-11]
MLTASGVPGNDCPPDLNLENVPQINLVVGQAFTIDLFANGATVVDLDASGTPTGDQIRLVLDPDVGTDTPEGAKISTSGVFTWTPTAGQVGTHKIIVIAIDRGTTPLADSETFTIVVSAEGNQTPSVDLNGPTAGTGYNGQFTEDGGPVAAVGANLTVTDADSPLLDSAKIVLLNHPDGAAESLSVDVTGTSIVVTSYNPNTGELLLSGSDSLANYQQVLRTLQYNNTSQDPDAAVRTIEVTVNDGVSDSVKAASKITVIPVNDAPTTDLNGDDAGTGFEATFTEGGGPAAVVDTDLALTDVDNTTLTSATVTITNLLDGDAEVLAVVTSGTAITASYVGGVLTLTGEDTLANYELVLRSLTYENSSENPTETARVIEVVVNDGADNSVAAISTVTILLEDDAPSVDLNGDDEGIDFSATFTEEEGPVAIVDTDLAIADADSATLTSATITITNLLDGAAEELAVETSGTAITASYVDGVLTLTGEDTLANYELVLRSLTYDNTSENPTETARVIEVIVNDGESDSVAAVSTVTVVGVNDAPDLESITDQEAHLGVLMEVIVTASDPEGDMLEFQLDFDDPSGNMPASATITKTSETTALISWTPSIEDGPGPFVFVVLVTDDDVTEPLSDSESFTVTLVNDPPIVDLNGEEEGTGFAATFTEDEGPVAIVDTDLTLTDIDNTTATSATVTITNLLDGAAEELAVETSGTAITASYVDGVLTLTGEDTLANYELVLRSLTYENLSENPTETARVIEVVVNDGSVDSIAAVSTVTVVGVNDAPNLEAITDQEAQVGVQMQVLVTASDSEGDMLEFQLDFDDPSGNMPASATITKTSETTALISWTPSIEDGPGPFVFVVLVTDDDAIDALSDSESFTVTLVNVSPIVDLNGEEEGTSFAATFTEDEGPVAIVDTDLTLTDVDNTTLASATVTITNLLDGADEELAVETTGTAITASYVDGVLTLTGEDTLANYELVLRSLTYENSSQEPTEIDRVIEVVVNDGADDSVAAVSTVTVVDVNESPNLEAIADQEAQVGVTMQVIVTASDLEGNDLTFQLDFDDPSSTMPESATITNNGDSTALIEWTPSIEDGPGPFVFVVLVTDNDPDFPGTDSESFTVTLTNAVPIVDLNGEDEGTGFAVTFTEDGGPVTIVDSDLGVFDTDGLTLTSATVTITNLLDGDAEVLTVDVTGTSIIATYVDGVLTMIGEDTLANYELVLRTLAYENTSQDPTEADRLIEVTVNDGTDDSVAVVSTVTVVADNDAPEVDLNGEDEGTGFASTFTEDAGPVAIVDTDLTVTDVDSTTLVSATVTITNLLDGDSELLAVNTTGTAITASYLNGVLTLTGEDTLANYELVLRTLAYENSAEVPTETDRTVEVVINDGALTSVAAVGTVTIVIAGEPPLEGESIGGDEFDLALTEVLDETWL